MVLNYKIIIAEQAHEDLARIRQFMYENKFEKFIVELYEKYDNLLYMPWMYPRLYYEKKTKADFRKIVYQKYIIIYKIQKSQITILRIVTEKENYLKPKLLEIY